MLMLIKSLVVVALFAITPLFSQGPSMSEQTLRNITRAQSSPMATASVEADL